MDRERPLLVRGAGPSVGRRGTGNGSITCRGRLPHGGDLPPAAAHPHPSVGATLQFHRRRTKLSGSAWKGPLASGHRSRRDLFGAAPVERCARDPPLPAAPNGPWRRRNRTATRNPASLTLYNAVRNSTIAAIARGPEKTNGRGPWLTARPAPVVWSCGFPPGPAARRMCPSTHSATRGWRQAWPGGTGGATGRGVVQPSPPTRTGEL